MARRHCQSGFSLIELIMVIVILGIASVSIAAGYTQLGRSLLLNEDAQAAAQQAQACAEHLLASRRNLGYAAMFGDCSLLGAYNGYGPPAVTTWVPVAPSCPGGAACTGYEVTATYGTSGATSRARFFVVN